jgi:serine/threonine-protein kinase RsbW
VNVETTELTLPSRVEAVNEAAAAIATVLGRAGIDEDAAFGIDMAFREAVTNAVLHGNKQDESKLVRVTVKSSPDWLEISVRDQGKGFDPVAIPDPTAAENIMKTAGRGIFFMRNFMDEVDWSIQPDGGTLVRMTKRF